MQDNETERPAAGLRLSGGIGLALSLSRAHR